jgi:hypothetical protein
MTAVGVEAQITEALFERLADLTLSPVLPVSYPDVVFPAVGQTKPDNYLEAAILRAQTAAVGLSKWDEHAGILQVTVVTKQFPAGGTKTPTQIADAVAAWFPRGTRLLNGSVQVDVYEKPAIASPIADAPYTRTPVSIRYRTFVR